MAERLVQPGLFSAGLQKERSLERIQHFASRLHKSTVVFEMKVGRVHVRAAHVKQVAKIVIGIEPVVGKQR